MSHSITSQAKKRKILYNEVIALSDEKNFSLEDVRPAPKGTHLSQSAPPVRRSIGSLPVWFWVVVAVVIVFLVCIGFLLLFGVVYWVLMGNGIN
jgi:hypothetical protein